MPRTTARPTPQLGNSLSSGRADKMALSARTGRSAREDVRVRQVTGPQTLDARHEGDIEPARPLRHVGIPPASQNLGDIGGHCRTYW